MAAPHSLYRVSEDELYEEAMREFDKLQAQLEAKDEQIKSAEETNRRLVEKSRNLQDHLQGLQVKLDASEKRSQDQLQELSKSNAVFQANEESRQQGSIAADEERHNTTSKLVQRAEETQESCVPVSRQQLVKIGWQAAIRTILAVRRAVKFFAAAFCYTMDKAIILAYKKAQEDERAWYRGKEEERNRHRKRKLDELMEGMLTRH
ncbi:hypothetical protein E4T43_01496 [Aureobasidium subglaciale]|nr:hypothetical protein E4T43_01496 [Aureobasidium subglaciale]